MFTHNHHTLGPIFLVMILGTAQRMLIVNGMGSVMDMLVTLSVTLIATVRSILTVPRTAFAMYVNK